MVNAVFYVERFVYKALHEGFKPSEEEVRFVGEMLGQPTKKIDVVLNRYKQVFKWYIVKRCADVDKDVKTCIYCWNQKVPFRLFPLALHAFGSVLLFKGEEPVEVLAYPMPKALSFAKSPGLPEEKYGSTIPREVTERIDGWQITAYFNSILNKWMFATRYALHNMYFEAGKLVVEDFTSIANPYVYVAHKLAEESGLYTKLQRFEKGWTFTFVLKGPEPAITKPPYPMGSDYAKYKLYLLFARDPGGKLYTWSESRVLLDCETPPEVKPEPLEKLYEKIVHRLDVRSYMAFIDSQDPENPIIAELESELYPDAMNVKHLYDAKSAAIISSEGFGERLAEIVEEHIRSAVKEIDVAVKKFSLLLNKVADIDAVAIAIVETLENYRPGHGVSSDEIRAALKSGNIKRVVKKVFSTLLEGKSLITKTTTNTANRFVEDVEAKLQISKNS